jgi:hypothetical protein
MERRDIPCIGMIATTTTGIAASVSRPGAVTGIVVVKEITIAGGVTGMDFAANNLLREAGARLIPWRIRGCVFCLPQYV